MIDLSNLKMARIYSPASNEEINSVESTIGINLPWKYQMILLTSNGFLTESGILIYGIEDVVERNATWEVQKYAEGHIAIGDDSGGRVLLMAAQIEATQVLLVDSGDMNPKRAIIITNDVVEWIAKGCEIKGDSAIIDHQYTKLYDVILISQVDGGLKDLIILKKALSLEMSTNELLKGSKATPLTLIRKISYGKASNILAELGDLQKKIRLVPSDL